MRKVLPQRVRPRSGSTTDSARNREVNQVPPKPGEIDGKSAFNTYTPLPQQERIKKKYADGMSIREIARKEGKARETITKIVRSPEMQALIQASAQRLRDEFVEIAQEIAPAIVYALRYSPDGGKLAFELADRFGALPPRKRLCPRCKRVY